MSSTASNGPLKTPWRVYAAHTLATWGDNMWWFAGGLYMVELNPDDLRWTAVYGLVLAATVICFAAPMGRWIDKTKRLTAARTFLSIQNCSVSICALILSLFLYFRDPTDPNDPLYVTLTSIAVIVFSSIGRLSSTGTVIILQRDWVVVITNNDSNMLAKVNSVLRSIELTTYMVAPALSGVLFSLIGYIWTGVFIAAWNIFSVSIEYTLLELIYKAYPALHNKISDQFPTVVDEENTTEPMLEEKKSTADPSPNVVEHLGIIAKCKEAYSGWVVYFNHPIRNAGLGLACLYMTVLGFDNITYGYIIIQGIPEGVLGVMVAISALVGVFGSLAFPRIRLRIGLERTGLVGMLLLVSTSSLSLVSVFLPGSPYMMEFRNSNASIPTMIKQNGTEDFEQIMAETWQEYASVSVLLIGIIVARFGLWIVDLTITQVLQERVEEERRGSVNGVQDALNNSMDLLKCVLVILLPQAHEFAYLILLSYASISLGWLLYALYSRKQRGHLFHFCRLVHALHPNDLHNIPRENEEKEEKEKMETTAIV